MPKANPHRPFTPLPEQMALRPAVSGNAINGLGGAQVRPPLVVHWAPDPDAIAHGAMQRGSGDDGAALGVIWFGGCWGGRAEGALLAVFAFAAESLADDVLHPSVRRTG